MVPSGTLLRIAVLAALASFLLALVPTTDDGFLHYSDEPMETGARSGGADFSWTAAMALYWLLPNQAANGE